MMFMSEEKENPFFPGEKYPYPEEIAAQLSSAIEDLSFLKCKACQLPCAEALSLLGDAINKLNVIAKQITQNHLFLCLNEEKSSRDKLDSLSQVLDSISKFFP